MPLGFAAVFLKSLNKLPCETLEFLSKKSKDGINKYFH